MIKKKESEEKKNNQPTNDSIARTIVHTAEGGYDTMVCNSYFTNIHIHVYFD